MNTNINYGRIKPEHVKINLALKQLQLLLNCIKLKPGLKRFKITFLSCVI